MYRSDFADILKQLRKGRGITQGALGAQVGLSKAVVSKYENGIGEPSLDTLIRIASYFGVTTDYLLGVDRGKTVNVSDLTDTQVEILHKLIREFRPGE